MFIAFLGGLLVFFDFSFLILFLGSFLVWLCLSSLSFSFSGVFVFDSISFTLIFLSGFIYFLSVYGSLQEYGNSNLFAGFVFCLSLIFFLLFVSFSTLSLFVFYVSFEFIFLVMFVFLLGWGYSPERRQASFYMVFYTLVVSFPFLVFLVISGHFLGSVVFFVYGSWSGYWWFFLMLVFMVKLPVYGAHLWLPKAHVEAPVSGSMVLAGVLLKLGGYGFYRLCGLLTEFLSMSSGYIFSLGLLGGLISCFFCLRQVDLKSFVAYSSVCHMGMALAGIFSFSLFGWWGGWLMLFGHGLCSSCLFYMLYVFYERFFSRSMFVLKGSILHLPLMAFWWFVFCALNMGVPPSLSFFSEIFIVMGLAGAWFFCVLFLGILLFFAGVYNIYLYVGVMHGGSFFSHSLYLPTVREYLVLFCHLFPSFLVVFFLGSFFWWSKSSSEFQIVVLEGVGSIFNLFSFLFFLLAVLFICGFFLCFFGGGYVLDVFFFSLCGFDLTFSFVFDFLSLGFAGCVAMISSVVFMYSNFYMAGTVDVRRFGYLVFLFVVSMFFLVFSGNFFTTMIGWDGLGLTSFCLVIFYANSVSLDSGLVTVFSNRVGDVFFLLAFFLFLEGGLWSFDYVFATFSLWFLVFLFLGSITKSAQIPFSAWLPAAMAAPTPVSSLVHSSTLVTAGVFVLIRYHYVFSFAGGTLLGFALGTMLLAGLCALLEKDYKKVIAMSTLSQLGMMLFILSVGAWSLSFLHMVIHAFFKSTLFLSSGMLISQMGGGQDSRFYGGFGTSSVSLVYFMVSCLALAGFPFVVGFYSKDSVISYFSGSLGGLCFALFLLGCIFTVGYSFRLVYSGFYSVAKACPQIISSESLYFSVPVFVLFCVCVFGGGLMGWFFLSGVSVFFRGPDLFWGLLLIVFGLAFYFSFRVSYYFLWFLGTISFLRWASSGGSSFLFRGMTFYRGESSWMEMSGGMGFFSFFSSISGMFSSVFGFGIKSVMLTAFLLSFLFHMCAVGPRSTLALKGLKV